MARMSDSDLGRTVLRILNDLPGGEGTVEQIAKKVPAYLASNPVGADVPAENWKERLTNLKLNDSSSGNIFRDYCVFLAPSGQWRISPNGQSQLKKIAQGTSEPSAKISDSNLHSAKPREDVTPVISGGAQLYEKRGMRLMWISSAAILAVILGGMGINIYVHRDAGKTPTDVSSQTRR
jgi:hypothetical protein